MTAAGGGAIVNTSSLFGVMGFAIAAVLFLLAGIAG